MTLHSLPQHNAHRSCGKKGLTDGNGIFVPFHCEYAPSLGFKIRPIGCSTPFKNVATAVGVCRSIAIGSVHAIIRLCTTPISKSQILGKGKLTVIVPVKVA